MWARIDDGIAEHPQILRAAETLGGLNQRSRVLGVFVQAIAYSCRYLTDGTVPEDVFLDVDRPVVKALCDAKLLRRNRSVFVIRKFLKWQPDRQSIEAIRQRDRLRKQRQRSSDDSSVSHRGSG